MPYCRSFVVAALAIPLAVGQIGGPRSPGGGYPGGGYPGGGYPPGSYPGDYPPGGGYPQGRGGGTGMPRIPFPRRNKDKTDAQKNGKLTNLKGTVVKFEDWELILETSDEKTLQVKCPPDTKYFRGREEIHPSLVNVGDEILMDAAKDSKGNYSAVRVTVTKSKEGAPAETASAKDSPGSNEKASTPADEDRPVLRRSTAPASTAPEKQPEPAAGNNAPATTVKDDPTPSTGDEGPPRLKRKSAPSK